MFVFTCFKGVSLLFGRCFHFSEGVVCLDGVVPIREVSLFQRMLGTGFNGVGTQECVPIREVSSFRELWGVSGGVVSSSVKCCVPSNVSYLISLQIS